MAKKFKGDVFRDETNSISSGRILLWIWTAAIIGELFFNFDALSKSQPLLVFLSGIYSFLIVWVAGPRIAKYLAPQIGKITNAIGQAKSNRTNEIDPTPDVPWSGEDV